MAELCRLQNHATKKISQEITLRMTIRFQKLKQPKTYWRDNYLNSWVSGEVKVPDHFSTSPTKRDHVIL